MYIGYSDPRQREAYQKGYEHGYEQGVSEGYSSGRRDEREDWIKVLEEEEAEMMGVPWKTE